MDGAREEGERTYGEAMVDLRRGIGDEETFFGFNV